MKSLVLFILSAITLFGCSTQNPNPTNNNTNNYSYTQGANLIDADGNVYPTFITSCGQTWMQKNLDVSHYRNGDVIPQVTDPTQWANLTTGACCYYDNNSANGPIYGKLYNWYAMNDPRGLAPSGYHVPSDTEWNKLLLCIDVSADTTNSYTAPVSLVSGAAMKETSTIHWRSPNSGATNSSGFTGLPGGAKDEWGGSSNAGGFGIWWTSTEFDNIDAWGFGLVFDSKYSYKCDYGKNFGFSVRCIKD